MVGGIVIGVTRLDAGDHVKTHVHVAECPHYPKHCEKGGGIDRCPRPDTCCVYVDEGSFEKGNRVVIQVGDSLWWQSGMCYWTPKENRGRAGNKCGVDFDIPLEKIGYSH